MLTLNKVAFLPNKYYTHKIDLSVCSCFCQRPNTPGLPLFHLSPASMQKAESRVTDAEGTNNSSAHTYWLATFLCANKHSGPLWRIRLFFFYLYLTHTEPPSISSNLAIASQAEKISTAQSRRHHLAQVLWRVLCCTNPRGWRQCEQGLLALLPLRNPPKRWKRGVSDKATGEKRRDVQKSQHAGTNGAHLCQSY